MLIRTGIGAHVPCNTPIAGDPYAWYSGNSHNVFIQLMKFNFVIHTCVVSMYLQVDIEIETLIDLQFVSRK
jgi:hypothetical protein